MSTKNILNLIILFAISSLVWANPPLGIGTVATNVLEPVSLFNDFIDTGCFIIGGAFLFASIIKYFEHRRSPLMVTLGTVVFLFIAGLVLVALPFVSNLTSNGVPYRLFN